MLTERYSSRVSRRGRMMVSPGGIIGGGAGRREEEEVSGGFRGRGGIVVLALVLEAGLKGRGLMVLGHWVGCRRRWLWRGHCRRRRLRGRGLWRSRTNRWMRIGFGSGECGWGVFLLSCLIMLPPIS